MVNVSPKTYPSPWSLGKIDEIEDDRRLLYVALTRAKNELIITRTKNSVYAESTVIEDQTLKEKIEDHYFLNGMPDDLVIQDAIEVFKKEVKDLDKPNEIIVNYGMDFN